MEVALGDHEEGYKVATNAIVLILILVEVALGDTLEQIKNH